MESLRLTYLRRFWRRIFNNEEDCRHYFNGLCLRKMMDEAIHISFARKYALECIMCDRFEKRMKGYKTVPVFRINRRSIKK